MQGKQQQDFRTEKYIRYGIRKYSFGAASVAIAAGLMFLGMVRYQQRKFKVLKHQLLQLLLQQIKRILIKRRKP